VSAGRGDAAPDAEATGHQGWNDSSGGVHEEDVEEQHISKDGVSMVTVEAA
jgi:hypothetical protein